MLSSNIIPLNESKAFISDASVYESLLYPELRLLTCHDFQDTIGIGYKFVEEPEIMMQSFYYFSRKQCFTGYSNSLKKAGDVKGRHNTKKKAHFLEGFPIWLNPKTGNTLNQWIAAFFEAIIVKRYLSIVVEKCSSFELHVEGFKKIIKENNNLVSFWKTKTAEDKLKCIQNFLKISKEEDSIKSASHKSGLNFLCYAIANSDAARFIESIYFMRLDIACNYISDFNQKLDRKSVV